MAPALIERTDVLCTPCGRTYPPEEMLLCSECGGGVCPQRATDGPQPLCPACISNALPRNIQPMLAVLSDMPPHEELWGLETARNIGLEGIIAKLLDSTYEPGCCSPHWRKVKVVNSQEFVIGGSFRKQVGALK